MDRSGLQRVIPIIIVVLVIAGIAWAMISLGQAFFGGGGSSSQSPAPVNSGKQALTTTTADRSVRVSVRGPIVAQENFHSYTISISPDSRTMTTYKGYLGEQLDTSQLDNNAQAYEQFVKALDRANMMEGTQLEGEANDTAGVCATGNLYMFEVLQATNVVRSLWTTTCKGSAGSLKANRQQLQNLFKAQIPDFTKLATKVRLS